MTTEASEKVLETIRRLLALSTSSNEYEAAAAAAKANELLLKYNLEASQLRNNKSDIDRYNMFRSGALWEDILINAICTTCCCKSVRNTRGDKWSRVINDGWGYAIFGTATNIQIVEYLFEYLSKTIDALAPYGKGRSYADNFRKGAVSIVAQRLRETFTTFTDANPNAHALIVVNDAAVSTKVGEDFPSLRHANKHRINNIDAYRDGIAAGKTIPINRPVTSNPLGQTLLN